VPVQNCWITAPADRPTFADLCRLFTIWHHRDAAAAADNDAIAIAVAISAAAAASPSACCRSSGGNSSGWQQSAHSFAAAAQPVSPHSGSTVLHHWEPFSGEDALGNAAANVQGGSDSQPSLPQPSSAGGPVPASTVCVGGGDESCTGAMTAPQAALPPLASLDRVEPEQGPSCTSSC
jgi:hypothetical protein